VKCLAWLLILFLGRIHQSLCAGDPHAHMRAGEKRRLQSVGSGPRYVCECARAHITHHKRTYTPHHQHTINAYTKQHHRQTEHTHTEHTHTAHSTHTHSTHPHSHTPLTASTPHTSHTSHQTPQLLTSLYFIFYAQILNQIKASLPPVSIRLSGEDKGAYCKVN
jgi:hypothetical protein